MILRRFPTLDEQRALEQQIARRAIRETRILYASTQEFFWKRHTAPFAVMFNTVGETILRTHERTLTLRSGDIAVMNEGEHEYCIDTPKGAPTQGLRIFFAQDFFSSLASGLYTPSAKVLDAAQQGQNPHFFEKVYSGSSLLLPALQTFTNALERGNPPQLWIDEQLAQLGTALFRAEESIHREIEELPAVRSATRIELYKRLYLAKEFIDAHALQTITLNDIAAAACLSPHHFLRLFKQAFRQTPHQYVTSQRLRVARYLLRHTRQPITDICFSLGFDSLGSFSTLFKTQIGISPREFRLQTQS